MIRTHRSIPAVNFDRPGGDVSGVEGKVQSGDRAAAAEPAAVGLIGFRCRRTYGRAAALDDLVHRRRRDVADRKPASDAPSGSVLHDASAG